MLSSLFPVPNNTRVAKLLLDLLNVKVSESALRKKLEEHPDYPSLLSISDVLNSYRVENLAVKFHRNDFVKLTVPFIVPVKDKKSDDGFFTVVRETTADTIDFYDPDKNRWRSGSLTDFLENWSGVALLTEAGEGSGEQDYNKSIRLEKRKQLARYFAVFCIPLMAIFAGVSAFTQLGSAALLPFLFLIFSLAGALAGVLLLWYEVDQHNVVIQQLCGVGKKVNCGAVLQSKASKIAGISWSLIGFAYFTGLLMLMLFAGITSPEFLFIASCATWAAVPYIFFSIYYQWRIARQWCTLCLIVQGILVLQAVTVLAGGWTGLLHVGAISADMIIRAITAFLVPVLTAAVLLPALRGARQAKGLGTELQRLKHNPQIFEALLHKQKLVTVNPHGLGITLGNPDATCKIIKVCNPYCGPCAKAHQPMEELLHNNPDIQLQILFTASNHESDTMAPPVKHLLALAELGDESLTKRALDDWYLSDQKDYEVFAAKYPLKEALTQQNAKVEAMHDWCENVAIEFTPTFFIALNDTGDFHQLPKLYRVTDLKYFLSV